MLHQKIKDKIMAFHDNQERFMLEQTKEMVALKSFKMSFDAIYVKEKAYLEKIDQVADSLDKSAAVVLTDKQHNPSKAKIHQVEEFLGSCRILKETKQQLWQESVEMKAKFSFAFPEKLAMAEYFSQLQQEYVELKADYEAYFQTYQSDTLGQISDEQSGVGLNERLNALLFQIVNDFFVKTTHVYNEGVASAELMFTLMDSILVSKEQHNIHKRFMLESEKNLDLLMSYAEEAIERYLDGTEHGKTNFKAPAVGREKGFVKYA